MTSIGTNNGATFVPFHASLLARQDTGSNALPNLNKVGRGTRTVRKMPPFYLSKQKLGNTQEPGKCPLLFVQMLVVSFVLWHQGLGWRQDNGNRSNQESKFDFLATRQYLVKIVKGQQKIKIVRTNRQSNLLSSCQSIFSLCRHHPNLLLFQGRWRLPQQTAERLVPQFRTWPCSCRSNRSGRTVLLAGGHQVWGKATPRRLPQGCPTPVHEMPRAQKRDGRDRWVRRKWVGSRRHR